MFESKLEKLTFIYGKEDLAWLELAADALGFFLIATNAEFIAEFTDFSGKCENRIMTPLFLKQEEMWQEKTCTKSIQISVAELSKNCLMSL